MTIYIDVVLLENLIMNFIILLATGLILKEEIKKVRLLLSSLLGAIYSVVSYMSILEIYSSMILKIILSIVIIYIAFNPQNMKKMWKDLLIFYLTSFVFGGAAFAFIYIIKPQEILMKNGLFLGTYPLKTIILGAIIAFIVIITAFTVVKSKITKKDMFCEVSILLNGKRIKTTAMLDTGNMLKEPITNTPVMVVEHTLLYECIPKEILNHLDELLGGDFNNIPENIKEEYMAKLKFIPFSSLGKQNGMLLGIRADSVTIKEEDTEKKQENIIIGMYNKSLTKRGEYRALIGIEQSCK
ncbi:MAG: sigma-E processing peptidase SpoIIGA [Clostridia bacterium]|nr:sigma-E processing peptidase SpoIIGA [Clostridia bacterium]